MSRKQSEYEKLCQDVWISAFNAETNCSVMSTPEDAIRFADKALEEFKSRFPDPDPPIVININALAKSKGPSVTKPEETIEFRVYADGVVVHQDDFAAQDGSDSYFDDYTITYVPYLIVEAIENHILGK